MNQMTEEEKDINAIGRCIELLQKRDDTIRELQYKAVPFELENYYTESRRIRISLVELMDLRIKMKAKKLNNIINKEK